MNVTIIAPHPDDEVIGCGGAAALHAAGGDVVRVVFLTSGELGLKHLEPEVAKAVREAEARRSVRILGLAGATFLRAPDWLMADHAEEVAPALAATLEDAPPDLLYAPHPADDHPDHAAALAIVQAAFQGLGRAAPEIRGYEIWTPLAQHDVVVDVTSVYPQKLRALRAHRSQLGYYDYVRAVRGLNSYRGAIAARSAYAEVFRVLT